MKRIVSRVLFGMLAFVCVAVTAKAAGINSAEQSLLDAVSQPFSYNGKTYVVSSSSISEGRAKLSEDDVELTQSDANDCISQFRQSYAELVAEGYCEEVKKDNDAVQDVQTTPEAKHSKVEQKRNKEFLKMILGNPPKNTSSNEKDSEKDNTEQAVKNSPSPEPETLENEWSYEEDAWETLKFDEQDIKSAVSRQLTITQGSRKYKLQAAEGQISVDKYTKRYLYVWKTVLMVLFGCTVIVLAGMFYYTSVFRRHHKRKRKLRLGLSVLGGICLAGWTLLLFLVAGLYFGVYSNGAIHRQLMESDYYSGVTQMAEKQAMELLERNGYDGGIAERIFDLSNIYIEEKQYIDAVLSGKGDTEISTDKIHKKLSESINQKGEKKDTALIQELEEDYKRILHFELGNRIKKSRDACLFWFYLAVTGGVVSFILISALIYQMYGKIYKTVQVGAVAMLLVSVVVTVSAVIVKSVNAKQKFSVRPVYYQEFLQSYISWGIQVMLYVGCIGMLCSIGLLAWRYHIRKLDVL